jgi:ABC-type transport system involved in multi-copper enzyme maturation permease subunit
MNPILHRELTTLTRSWKSNFLLWSYLLLLAGLLLILWPGSGIHSVAAAGSKKIFSLFFSVNLTLLILLVPAFAATAITSEREGQTYGALFTTLLTPFEIMTGKLLAAVTMLLALVALSLPIGAVCALTGGVSMAFMTDMMLVLVVTALSYGLVGLACSALCQRSSTAIVVNYVLILLLAGGTWLPAALLGNLLPQFQGVLQLIRSFSPFDALFYLLSPDRYRMTTGTLMSAEAVVNPFTVFLGFSGIVGLIAFRLFQRRIFRPMGRRQGAAGEMFTDRRKALKRKLSWPFYLIDPLKRKKNIGRWSNPVFVAEMRSRLFANPKFVVRTVSAIFIVSMLILTLIAVQYATFLNADIVRVVAIVFQLGVVGMLAPGVSSGLITEEISSGTLLALRLTPLQPLAVIMGKLKATFFFAMIFVVSSFFVIFAMAYLEHQTVFPELSCFSGDFWHQLAERIRTEPNWWGEFWSTYRRIAIWIAILLLSTVTFLTGGLFASSVARTTGIATAISYALTATICLVTMAPLVLGEKLPPSLAAWLLASNPVAAAIQATSEQVFSSYPGLWHKNLLILSGLTLAFLAAATVRLWFLFRKQE